MAVMVETGGEVHQANAADPFECLFVREYTRLLAIASRVLADRDEAEDVVQEVFMSFYHRHDPTAPYAASWLHAATVHTALNAIRGKRRRRQREEADAYATDRLRPSEETILDPQRALEEQERRREVQAALSRLPAKSAAVLILRYSGLSYAEVAEALGVKIGQVGTLLRRAEEALRKEMTHATPR